VEVYQQSHERDNIMLWQIHHQYRDGHTEMVMQGEPKTRDELRAMLEEANIRYPLPEKAIWMWCNENAPEFVVTPSK
jgi:hypothetical protein